MDIPPLTEDDMADIKKEVLLRLRPYLCDKLIADRHFDYLRSRKILTREDTEEISCRSTQRKKAGMLLDYLAENPRGLDALVESIRLGRSLGFVIAKITDEVQRVKNEKLHALRVKASTSNMAKTGAASDLLPSDKYESSYDKCPVSTLLCHHPDGEGSQSSSTSIASNTLNTYCGSGSLGKKPPSVTGGGVASSASSALLRPGDPGAPPLPDEAVPEGSETACASTGCSGDAQPLRSRSVTPTSHQRYNTPWKYQ